MTAPNAAASTPIAGFDHPVIAVDDMHLSRERFARMGFMVPPRGSHKEWGTGNWCIMFPHDYLELRGIVDSARYTHHLDRFLAKREGLMGVAFAPAIDVEEGARRLRARGLHPQPPRELTRNFELPEGPIDVRFRLLFFDTAETGGMMASLICQHLTPERIRRPDFLVHANTADRVLAMTSVVDDLDAAEATAKRYFDAVQVERREAAVDVAVGRGATLRFVTRAVATSLGIDLPGVPPPFLSSVEIGVASIAACEVAFREGGVRFERRSPVTLRVAAADACGTILDFTGTTRD